MSIHNKMTEQVIGEINVGVLWEFLIWLHKNDPERYGEYIKDKDELRRAIKSLKGGNDDTESA